MIRYRDRACGLTRHSVARCKKHIERLGKLSYVKGYRYWGRYHAVHESVLIRGEHGTIRLDGLCWGYRGEGPHGLRDVLTVLGVDNETASKTAFQTERKNEIGEDWRIPL